MADALAISKMDEAEPLDGSELVEVAQLSPTITITAGTISAQASDNSLNDSGNGFLAAGFLVGMNVHVSGFTGNVANNAHSLTITALTSGKMTIGGTDGNVIVDDAAGESVTITAWETKRTTVSALSSSGDVDVAEQIVAADAKTTPVDADSIGVVDSEDGNALKELTFVNLKKAIAGKQGIWVAAGSITPSASGGCAALATIASSADQPDIQTLDFDASTQEYAQFSVKMPKSWDEGTVTFVPVWSHASTTTNFGVVWSLQAVAIGNDDAIAASFGTAQTSTDTGGTTNDLYIGPESSAITIAGTPQAEDVVFFRVSRVTGDGSDNMEVDARLHGVMLFITTDTTNDA